MNSTQLACWNGSFMISQCLRGENNGYFPLILKVYILGKVLIILVQSSGYYTFFNDMKTEKSY